MSGKSLVTETCLWPVVILEAGSCLRVLPAFPPQAPGPGEALLLLPSVPDQQTQPGLLLVRAPRRLLQPHCPCLTTAEPSGATGPRAHSAGDRAAPLQGAGPPTWSGALATPAFGLSSSPADRPVRRCAGWGAGGGRVSGSWAVGTWNHFSSPPGGPGGMNCCHLRLRERRNREAL